MTATLLILLAAGLGAAGQFLFRAGSLRTDGWVPHPLMFAGMGCYLAVMVLFGRAFRAGAPVPTLYPVYASTFIFAAVLGHFVHGVPLKAAHYVGMALLVGGIRLMTQP